MTFWVAGAAVVGAVGGAMIASDGAQSAADTQANATRESNATQKAMYDQTRSDNLPFLQTGYKANDQINALIPQASRLPSFADYQKDPSYDWQQREAMRIGQNTAAARNGLYRGSTLKALQDRSQNIANADYGSWWNRQEQGITNRVNLLNAIRSGGQAASGQIGAAGQGMANAISGNQTALGNALGASQIAQGNIWGGTLNNLSSYGNQNNWWKGGGIDTSGSGSLYGGNANGSLNGIYGVYGD